MTIDSPKGPERDRRVRCGSCRQHETVERLTAEAALLRERDALTRKALRIDEDGPLQFMALRVRQQRDKAVAEVSRLREELATAVVLPKDADEADAVCQALKQRDEAQEWADKLAYAVAPVEVIGEHSNCNEPWRNALEILEAREAAPVSESVPATPRKQWGIRFFDGSVRLQSGEGPAREFAAHWEGAEVVSRPVADWVADPPRASAPSEASPHPDQEILLAKIAELQTRGPVQYADSEDPPLFSPPSSGDSDTTPREFENGWMCRDCGHPEGPFSKDESWKCERHKVSPPSLPQEGGTDEETL